MKSKAIICAIAAASLGFGSLSFAQGYDNRGGPNRQNNQPPRVEQRGPGADRDGRDGRFGGPGNFDNRMDNRDHRDARNDRQFGARGPDFHRGGRIPGEYRSRQYVVNDWRAHRLAPPQRGQQWVQVGGDYALIAIATGVIAGLVLSQ